MIMYTLYKLLTIDSTYDFSTNESMEYLCNQLSDVLNESALDFNINYDSNTNSIIIQDPLLDFNMNINISLVSNNKQIIINYNSSDGCTGSRRLNNPYTRISNSYPIYLYIYICNLPSMKFIMLYPRQDSLLDMSTFCTLINLEKYPTYGHLLDNNDIPNIYDLSYGLYAHNTKNLERFSISGSPSEYNRNLILNENLNIANNDSFLTSLIELPIFTTDFSNLLKSPIKWINTVKSVYFSQQGNLDIGSRYTDGTNSFIAIFPNILYKL